MTCDYDKNNQMNTEKITNNHYSAMWKIFVEMGCECCVVEPIKRIDALITGLLQCCLADKL